MSMVGWGLWGVLGRKGWCWRRGVGSDPFFSRCSQGSSQLCVCRLGGGVAVGGRGLSLGGLLGIPVSRLLLGLKGVERSHRHQGVPLVLLIHWVRILSLGKHTNTINITSTCCWTITNKHGWIYLTICYCIQYTPPILNVRI